MAVRREVAQAGILLVSVTQDMAALGVRQVSAMSYSGGQKQLHLERESTKTHAEDAEQ